MRFLIQYEKTSGRIRHIFHIFNFLTVSFFICVAIVSIESKKYIFHRQCVGMCESERRDKEKEYHRENRFQTELKMH